jgi:hypothetical protein
VDELRNRMESRAVDCRLWLQALVEDCGHDLQESAPQAGAAGCASRQCNSISIEGDGGSHHARHPLTGLQRDCHQVGLAEHAVQVQVEAR